MSRVSIAPDAEAVALASMLADVVESNLGRHPARIKDFNRLNGNVGITAADAEVDITITFNRGECVFHQGLHNPSKLLVTADAQTLMELTNLEVRFAIPWLFDETGLSIIRKLLKRELKVGGLLFHPLTVIGVLKVLSVV